MTKIYNYLLIHETKNCMTYFIILIHITQEWLSHAEKFIYYLFISDIFRKNKTHIISRIIIQYDVNKDLEASN